MINISAFLRAFRSRSTSISSSTSTDNRWWRTIAEVEQLAGIGRWEMDAISGELKWSPSLCLMLGLDPWPERFAESEFWELIHPDDRQRVKGIVETATKAGRPYEHQARFVLRDGTEKVLLTHGLPVLDAAGKRIIKRVGITQDVTERVCAEAALKASEERYRDLVENSKSLMCLHDLDGTLRWMNDLPAQLLGYSPAKLIGRRIQDMLEPDIRDQFDDYVKRIRRDGHAEGLLKLVARSGERRIWEYQNTLRTGTFGVALVHGMAHDITELKRTEKSLRTFRTLIDLSNDGFVVIDADSLRILDVNENICSKLGYMRDEVLRLFVADIDPTFDEEGVRKSGALTREGVYRRKDGLMFPVEVNLSFAHLKQAYFIGVVRDITERKRTEQLLRGQQDQLRLLTAHLIASHDRERRQVARALNEGTAQELGGVSLELGMLRQANVTASALGIVDESQEALSRAMTQIRVVSNELHPHLLELAGLWAAISSYAIEFGRTHGIQMKIDLPDKMTRRLSDEEEIGVFRVVQECLAVIHERSGSEQISIRVDEDSSGTVIEVSNSGEAQTSALRDYSEHELRLVEMAERVRQFRGVLAINTANAPGTTVRLSFPTGPRPNETLVAIREMRC